MPSLEIAEMYIPLASQCHGWRSIREGSNGHFTQAHMGKYT